MNTTILLNSVDINKLCQQGAQLQGKVSLADLKRLDGLVIAPFNDLDVNLAFSTEDKGLLNITGELNSELNLRCERCQEMMSMMFSHNFSVTPVKTPKEAKKLPDHLDPIIIQKDGHLELQFLLEDEIILNLPLVPRHEPSACSVKLAPASASHNERKKPFEGLASLINLEE